MLWKLLEEIWELGFIGGLYLVAITATIILLVQVGWSIYRYVTDMAETEGNSYGDRRKLFCGRPREFISRPLPGSGLDQDELLDAFLISSLYVIIGFFAFSFWPLTLMYILVHGSLYLLRGSIRFKKRVNKALESKSDKNHDHGNKYKRR